MDFRRLRLAGFKSFVEPAELRIEPGLTGVVGPNGCGKSNLLEAIRWVMGEGSPKSLRGGGMDDVIFAGTATRPSRDFAEVLLTIDRAEETVEVLRRIERGLGSAYRINGRDVRARDVQLLFADAATGAHSPALVSQGRIGAIIAAKPGERRALLEEAAGIAGLHVRRKEAEIRLRATEANLLRLDDVIAGLEAQVAALRRQAKAAERYRALSERVRAAEAALLHARWAAARTAADTARAQAARGEAAVTAATREAARLATAQADAAASLPGLREAEAVAAAELQALVQARRGFEAEAHLVERRGRELAQMLAALARDRAREDGLGEDARAAGTRLAAEATALAARAAEAKAALPALATEVGVAETATGTNEAALSAAIEAHARAAAQARAATAALDGAEARWRRADAEAKRLAAQRDADTGTAPLVAREATASATLAGAATAVTASAEAITVAEAERRAAETVREGANDALLAARGAAAALRSEHDALARLLAAGAGKEPSLLDRITVAPGDELALAAALGDDLSAALGEQATGRFWVHVDRHSGANGDDEKPLAIPLVDRCAAPPELARRLAATFIADPADAPALALDLAPGQRIVTRDGKLWRWDGFRAFGGQGVAVAERLVQRNRLAALAPDLVAADATLAAAKADADAADARYRLAVDAERSTRATRASADRALDAARAAHAAVAADLARAATRRDAQDAAIARLVEDAAGFRREADAASAAVGEITNVAALAEDAAAARTAVDRARAELVRTRAAHAALMRDLDAGGARLGAIGDERAGWTRRLAASGAQAAELDRRAAAASTETAALADRPAAIAVEVATLARRIVDAEAARRRAADTLVAAEFALRGIDADVRTMAEALAQAREARAAAAAKLDHEAARTREIEAQCGERFGCSPPMLPGAGDDLRDADTIARDFEALTAERERIGPVNLRADIELAELDATATGSAAERAELDTAIARLRGSIGALNREGRVRLLAAFEQVDAHFRDLFGTLFAGGRAHLALTESDDPLDAGLEIMAQPPGKTLQSLTLLSGGEQALTAVALIFALFLTTPSPLCVLDEVDAPLDDANVERFCDLLDRMAGETATRFLIVTHNAVTMSRMHRLYGVTMSEKGVSQLVSVDLRAAETLLAAE